MLLLCCLVAQQSGAQQYFVPPSDTYRPDRLRRVVIGETLLFAATSLGLYFLWYKKFPRSRFHFINDNREWLQVDKIGHATTAYTLANMHYDLMRWSGVKQGPAIASGAIGSLLYMSIIEVMDGFSRDWGFSKGDMLANMSGVALFAAQQYAWGEQRISMRFSASFTPFAKHNPNLLGKGWAARLMKDYNGQTYWLSLNPRSFMASNSQFPQWLNIAAGYGATGMTGANQNPETVNGMRLPSFKRTRQYYLSADVDWRKVKSVQPVNTSLYLLQFLKTPAPAIEFNSSKKIILHPIQF